MAYYDRHTLTPFDTLIGIDEVGRGPLAGPLVVCAVAIRPTGTLPPGVTDSKKLSAIEREQFVELLLTLPHAFAHVTAPVIDRDGMTQAHTRAVARVLSRLAYDPLRTLIMLDGRLKAPAQWRHQVTMVKGDEREPLIGAASILAKVRRDAYMTKKAREFPEYGFDQHKGYGTPEHREAIKQYGLSPLHRASWCEKCHS